MSNVPGHCIVQAITCNGQRIYMLDITPFILYSTLTDSRAIVSECLAAMAYISYSTPSIISPNIKHQVYDTNSYYGMYINTSTTTIVLLRSTSQYLQRIDAARLGPHTFGIIQVPNNHVCVQHDINCILVHSFAVCLCQWK